MNDQPEGGQTEIVTDKDQAQQSEYEKLSISGRKPKAQTDIIVIQKLQQKQVAAIKAVLEAGNKLEL